MYKYFEFHRCNCCTPDVSSFILGSIFIVCAPLFHIIPSNQLNINKDKQSMVPPITVRAASIKKREISSMNVKPALYSQVNHIHLVKSSNIKCEIVQSKTELCTLSLSLLSNEESERNINLFVWLLCKQASASPLAFTERAPIPQRLQRDPIKY